jgi:hypothetical protein
MKLLDYSEGSLLWFQVEFKGTAFPRTETRIPIIKDEAIFVED